MLLNVGLSNLIVLMILLILFVFKVIGNVFMFVKFLNRIVFFFMIGSVVLGLIFLRLSIVVLLVIIVIMFFFIV